MTNKKLRLTVFVSIAVTIALFCLLYVLGVAQLSHKSRDMVAKKLESKTLEAELTNMASAKKDIETYGYFNNLAKTVIPSDKDQAQAVVDIFNFASQSGFEIASINFPTSNLGTKAGTTPTNTNQSAVSASPSTAVSQAQPVKGIAGLYSLNLIIKPNFDPGQPDNLKPTYPKIIDFLRRIEQNRRTAQISNIQFLPQSTDTGPSAYLNFSLSINIFIKP